MTNGYVNLPKGLIDKIGDAVITNTETLSFTDEHLASDLYNCLISGKPALAFYSGTIESRPITFSLPFSYATNVVNDNLNFAFLFGLFYVGKLVQVAVSVENDKFFISMMTNE